VRYTIDQAENLCNKVNVLIDKLRYLLLGTIPACSGPSNQPQAHIKV
jgi:hypothetical protein